MLNQVPNLPNNIKLIIQDIEQRMGNTLPKDYLLLLAGSNSQFRNVVLTIFSPEEIQQINNDYKIEEFMSGALLVGSDGGDEALIIDMRAGSDTLGKYYLVPFIPLNWKEAKLAGSTFSESVDFYKKNFLTTPS
jgi:hypothetical protein